MLGEPSVSNLKKGAVLTTPSPDRLSSLALWQPCYVIAALPGVNLGHAARIGTVVSGDVMLDVACTQASPDVSDRCIGQREP